MSIQYCPYTNSSPPHCATLHEENEKLKRRLESLRERLKEYQKRLDMMPKALQTIAELITRIPKLKHCINYGLTALNFPSICLCTHELTLTKRQLKALQKLGYEVNWGCVCACGYGQLETKEDGNMITFIVHPCMCHDPYQYFLALEPRKKEEEENGKAVLA